MHKILIAFFLLVFFLFPNSEVFAEYVPGCAIDTPPDTSSPISKTSRINGAIKEVDCPDTAVCFIIKNLATNEHYCQTAAPPAPPAVVAPVAPATAPAAFGDCGSRTDVIENGPPVAFNNSCPPRSVCYRKVNLTTSQCFEEGTAAAGGAPKCKKVTGWVCPIASLIPFVGGPLACNVFPATKTTWECSEYPETIPSTQDNQCVCLKGTASLDCSEEKNKDLCTGGRGTRCDLKNNGAPIKVTDKRTDKNIGIYTAIGCIPTEPKALIEGLLKFGTMAAGGIAFIIMLLAALQMITAEGNPESIKAGQEKFYSAIIGLLLIIFAVLLMQVIGVDILGLPGFGNKT